MVISKDRLHAFSDGIIVITITIMVFNIQLPVQYDRLSLMTFAYRILIFLISFLIIGSEWMKHCELFEICKRLSGKILWINILYLFTLSLMPLFTRWIMSNPGELVPALAYDAVFFLLTSTFRYLRHVVLKQSIGEEHYERIKELRSGPMDRLLFLMGLVMMFGIVMLSLLYPTTSIIFFVCLPILPSIYRYANHAHQEHQQLRQSRRMRSDINMRSRLI